MWLVELTYQVLCNQWYMFIHRRAIVIHEGCHMWNSNCIPFRSTCVHPWILVGVHVARSLAFCIVLRRSLFVVFLLAIVLSVFLRFTAADYLPLVS